MSMNPHAVLLMNPLDMIQRVISSYPGFAIYPVLFVESIQVNTQDFKDAF